MTVKLIGGPKDGEEVWWPKEHSFDSIVSNIPDPEGNIVPHTWTNNGDGTATYSPV